MFCPGDFVRERICPGGFVRGGGFVRFFLSWVLFLSVLLSSFLLRFGPVFLCPREVLSGGVVPGPFSAKSATSAELVVRVRGLGRGVARNRAELSPACVGLPQPIRICPIGCEICPKIYDVLRKHGLGDAMEKTF